LDFHLATRDLCATLFAMLLCACNSNQADGEPAWAVNIGGPAYTAVDGTEFAAEESVSGGRTAAMDIVIGSQDPQLYRAYRSGDVRIARPLADGSYDLTFYFAEPEEIATGERVFDVFAEDRRIVDDLDVMQFRDGKIRSALTVTVPDVSVEDGELNIRFEASAREPLLSALLVHRKPAAGATGELTWSDEFDVDGAPNASKWTVEEWLPGKVNAEDQAYTARSRNVRVEDGYLVIEAHKEDYKGGHYTSGRLHSSGKGDFLYGRIEVRARLPRGQGTWPAIWMLSSKPFHYASNCGEGTDWQGNDDCDAWPNSGEIDIMEHVGYLQDHVHSTVHTAAYYWRIWNQRKGRILMDDVSEAFHVYAVEWTPERIDIFVDDTAHLTYVNEGNGWREWPFDQPFHVILNFAVGGAWGRAGGPIDDSVYPQKRLVDYVRVYRLPN
jgi:beta-glucanase (GH16 family)